ncbi:MAG TPA: hypothetical protein VH165_17865 [Kofleriaceae bacterium]|nr:hypothetical protein [Kofleriaceae bacterium]
MATDEPKPARHVDDLRGAGRLAIDATTGVTDLIEAMHLTIASGPGVLGRPLAAPARVVTGLVYGAVRGVTRAVGATLDAALATLGPVLGEGAAGPHRTAVQAALNGVLGDYLAETANPLALAMTLQHGRQAIPSVPTAQLPASSEASAAATTVSESAAPATSVSRTAAPAPASSRLIILVHGLAMHPGQWLRNGHDHGAALAAELGATALYAGYNTGRHISTNGAELAALLERTVAAWPVPVDSIILLGHSMGGLVARSACAAARTVGHTWLSRLRALISLGSPHHGAALERGGNWTETLLGISAYSAPFRRLARIRSAGVTDLRHGNVLDADWHGHDRFALGGDRRTPLPLPTGVACFAIAATTAPAAPTTAATSAMPAASATSTTPATSATSATPATSAISAATRLPGDGVVSVANALGQHTARLPGDGLVSVASALGQHALPAHTLRFPDDHRWIAFGTNHLDLLDAPAVYAQLRTWLTAL